MSRWLGAILYPDLLIEVVVNPEIIIPSYLQCIWDSPLIRCDIESKSRTAAGIYKINQANLSSIMVLLPPVSRQREIVELLGSKMKFLQGLQQFLQSQLDTINQLPAALLRQAFNGEL